METAMLCCALFNPFSGSCDLMLWSGCSVCVGDETAIMKRLEMNDILSCIDVMCCLVAPPFFFSSSFFVLCLGDGVGMVIVVCG
jgi:hypothetical protein